jgi:peptidoglycan/LPS O-acetylase OafA/YrhL
VHNGLLLLLTLSTAALVVALDRPGPARARGPLVAFGRLSYELYLTHMFVVLALVGAWRALGGPPGARWVLVPFGLLGSAALGALTARGFTRPVEARLRGGQGPQTG